MSLYKSLYKIVIPVSLLSLTPIASANTSLRELSPFVGADVAYSNMGLKPKYGGEIFRKQAYSYNLFTGLNFNQFFGLELGHQRDNNRRATRKLVEGQNSPGGGVISAASSPVIFSTLTKAKYTYLGVTAQYPLVKKLKFTALIGASKSSIRAKHTLKSMGGRGEYSPEQIQESLFARTYKKSKFIPMMRLGAKYKINEIISLRAGTTWLGTSSIKIDSQQNGLPRAGMTNAPNNSIRLKNTMNYALGVLVDLI